MFIIGSCLLLLFEFAGEHFGIPAAAVREVLPLPLLSRPPGTPAPLAGFLNLGGSAVGVLCPRRLFLLPDSPPGLYAHLILLRGAAAPLALLVDRAGGTVEISDQDVLPVGKGHSFNGCVEGEAIIEGRTIHLLLPEKLLLKEERTRIAELQAMETERLLGLEAKPA